MIRFDLDSVNLTAHSGRVGGYLERMAAKALSSQPRHQERPWRRQWHEIASFFKCTEDPIPVRFLSYCFEQTITKAKAREQLSST